MENNTAPIVEPLLSAFINTANPQTIYVRVEDPNQDCIAHDSFTLNVLLGPTMLDPIPPFNMCAHVDDVGFTTFVLTDKNAELLNGQTNVDVFYYETEALANAAAPGTNLDSPYANTTAYNQTIWVVLVDNVTHCSSTVGAFDLIVHDAPDITWDIDTLEVCDPDSDGFEFFDLSLANAQIIGALGGGVTVTYHETQTDADLGENIIQDAQGDVLGLQYANIGDGWTQTIYARVENTTTGCHDTVALNLQVNPTPQINFVPDDLEVCDDSVADGLVVVDLTQQEENILGGLTDTVAITYYHNESDAWAETDAIPPDFALAYTNSINPETIWVRVAYEDTNCASVVHFDIIVNPLPVLETPTPLELCDDDQDGNDDNGGFDIGSILGKMQDGGMTDIAQSWLGDGDNQPMEDSHVTEIFGADKISDFASQLGMSESEAIGGLRDAMPQMVDNASSGGSLLDSIGGIGGALSMASKLFGR